MTAVKTKWGVARKVSTSELVAIIESDNGMTMAEMEAEGWEGSRLSDYVWQQGWLKNGSSRWYLYDVAGNLYITIKH